jgi:hypothetical protein
LYFFSAVKVRRKEEKANSLSLKNDEVREPVQIKWKFEDNLIRPMSRKNSCASNNNNNNNNNAREMAVLTRNDKKFALSENLLLSDDFGLNQKSNNTEKTIDLFYSDESPIRMSRVKYVIFLEVLMIVDQLIEGNSKVPSFLGIKK